MTEPETGSFSGARRQSNPWVAMVWALVVPALAAALPSRAQEAPSRHAFVVGNAAYDIEVPRATRDARDMADTLKGLGYTGTLLLNSDAATFSDALEGFKSRATAAGNVETVVFYFSGYGAQIAGESYILPIDTPLSDSAGARGTALPLADILDRMGGATPTVALLDASRPLPQETAPGVTPGLGSVEPGPDTVLASAAQPGRSAPVDTDGRNSAFTRALLGELGTQGRPLDRVMADIRDTLVADTDGAQDPWTVSTLQQPVFLNPFRPDEADFELLAGMSEDRQDFMLEIWRDQGADITKDEIAMRRDGASDPRPPDPWTVIEGNPPGTPEDGSAAREDETGGDDGIIDMGALDRDQPQDDAPTPTGDAPVPRYSPVAAPLGPAPRSLAELDRLIGEDITESWLVPDDLAVAVQEELKRVGCYTAGIDGIWGGGSRRALRSYVRETGADVSSREPTAEVWRSVQAADGRICAPPARRTVQPAPANRQPVTPAPNPAPTPAPAESTTNNADKRLEDAFRSGFR